VITSDGIKIMNMRNRSYYDAIKCTDDVIYIYIYILILGLYHNVCCAHIALGLSSKLLYVYR